MSNRAPSISRERFYAEPARLAPHERGDARKADLPPTADIAARLRNGASFAAIAAQYGITAHGLRERMHKSGWRSDGQKLIERRGTICGWCGRRMGPGTKSGTCGTCRSVVAGLKHAPKDGHALSGGQWVVKRGVQVWVADEDVAA